MAMHVREAGPETKPCEHCGQPFKPGKPWQRFGNAKCRDAYHNERRDRSGKTAAEAAKG